MDDSVNILLRDVCDTNKFFKLSDGKTLALGRNPETQILDTRCSRVQCKVSIQFIAELQSEFLY